MIETWRVDRFTLVSLFIPNSFTSKYQCVFYKLQKKNGNDPGKKTPDLPYFVGVKMHRSELKFLLIENQYIVFVGEKKKINGNLTVK